MVAAIGSEALFAAVMPTRSAYWIGGPPAIVKARQRLDYGNSGAPLLVRPSGNLVAVFAADMRVIACSLAFNLGHPDVEIVVIIVATGAALTITYNCMTVNKGHW